MLAASRATRLGRTLLARHESVALGVEVPRPRPPVHAAVAHAPPRARAVAGERELALLRQIEEKANWLSCLMVHNANNVRPSRDGLKVGGHQASSASLSTILTALFARVLEPQDRVAVKPHASPMYHALQYMMGRQTLDNLKRFRSLGGVQAYPSRTKDLPEVDFSTGSVGLGPAVTAFAALTESYLRAHGLSPKPWPGTSEAPSRPGRMVSIVGDAEMDEGNVFEALLESWKLDIPNAWCVVDYNRQSLDKNLEEASHRIHEKMFRLAGWSARRTCRHAAPGVRRPTVARRARRRLLAPERRANGRLLPASPARRMWRCARAGTSSPSNTAKG